MVEWECVVEVGQVYRHPQSGCISEVVRVRDAHGIDAKVTLRPIDMSCMPDLRADLSCDTEILASALCGSSFWERLSDDEGDTVIWGGAPKIGVGAMELR